MTKPNKNKTDGATNLKRFRVAAELSQAELCRRSGEAITVNRLYLVENGGARPSQGVAVKLAAVFGKPVLAVFPDFAKFRSWDTRGGK